MGPIQTFLPKGLTIYELDRGRLGFTSCSVGRTGAAARSLFTRLSPARRLAALFAWHNGHCARLEAEPVGQIAHAPAMPSTYGQVRTGSLCKPMAEMPMGAHIVAGPSRRVTCNRCQVRLGEVERDARKGVLAARAYLARLTYAALWQSLHTAEGQRWGDDPPVVALTFRIERGNIDRIAA